MWIWDAELVLLWGMVPATFRKVLLNSSAFVLHPSPGLRSQGIGKEAGREKKVFLFERSCAFRSLLSALLHAPQKTAPSSSLITCVPG